LEQGIPRRWRILGHDAELRVDLLVDRNVEAGVERAEPNELATEAPAT
jgi:hypothetical protein